MSCRILIAFYSRGGSFEARSIAEEAQVVCAARPQASAGSGASILGWARKRGAPAEV